MNFFINQFFFYDRYYKPLRSFHKLYESYNYKQKDLTYMYIQCILYIQGRIQEFALAGNPGVQPVEIFSPP